MAGRDPRRAIRLTYLITDLKVGGVPLHLYRLATRLPKDRVRVRVISLADEGPVGAMLREAGIPVFGCGARSPADVRALWRLWRLLRSEPTDILHSLLFHANVAARLIGPIAGLPIRRIISEIQTAERERRWHLVVDNLTCRLCRFEVGNSPSVIEHLHRHAHLPISRLHSEWGAVDVDAIASARAASRAELGLPDDEPMVVWTGRLDPVKGFEEMLTAFRLVCRRHPARLLLAGEGSYRRRVESLIRENALSDRVLMLGERSDVPALLKAADLFLFCSRTEGLPNALLEAMAAGLPIVATDVPGCRDLIADGERGLLVPAGEAERIAEAVCLLLDDPVGGRAHGTRARRWVRDKLAIGELAGRWMSIYRDVCRMAVIPDRL